MKEHLGHYDIIAELGRGGMGVVYKGYETSLNRYVAIKVLAESLAHDESVKERFLREARSMAALNDPHIISIYFIGDDAGQTYFVMEFVDGESLGSLLKREGKLKPEQAAKIVYQTAQGLATAHDRGVIHRDIKPGNLMLTSKGAVKIADFGIALSTQDFSKKLTSTGEFVGTPGYLSPEVCQGKPVDQRSDIFSLGIVLFECLAGRMPFTDESPLGLMLEVVKAEIPDVRTLNAEVDPELERILARMVAKDPAERYQSCQELVADLGRHPLV
ncbi:MAG: serine/threonine protein kinase, partial [Xanthomonadaceae bacterium]|nr:serine/threonine protein kinase [Xanthomonadaceae bacterium]